MIKKNDEENKKGITESFLGGIPILGGFFKELGKTETFQERFKEVDRQIEENLQKGETLRNRKTISGALKTQGVLNEKKWGFEANFSVRPIMSEVKKETSELSVHEDYFYGRKGPKLTLAVKVPQEEAHWKITGKNLLITTDNFEKSIELPDYFKGIKKKQYQKGILVLELTK